MTVDEKAKLKNNNSSSNYTKGSFFLTIILIVSSIVYTYYGMAIVIASSGVMSLYVFIKYNHCIVKFQFIDWIFYFLNIILIISGLYNSTTSIGAYINPIAAILIWFLLRNIYRNNESLYGMLNAMGFSSIIMSILVIVDKFNIFNFELLLRNPNQISILLFIGTFYSFANFYLKRNKKLLFVLMLNSLALILLFSRSSILALAVAIAYYFLKTPYKKRFMKVVIFFIFIGLVVYLIMPNYLIDDILSTIVYKSNKGLSGRNEIWNVTFKLLNGSPFLGYSWEYSPFLSQVAPGRFAYRNLTSPHNTYFHYGLMGGYLSLSMLAVFIMNIISRLYRRKDESLKIMKSLLLGFIIISLFESLVIGGFGIRNILLSVIFVASVGASNRKA